MPRLRRTCRSAWPPALRAAATTRTRSSSPRTSSSAGRRRPVCWWCGASWSATGCPPRQGAARSPSSTRITLGGRVLRGQGSGPSALPAPAASCHPHVREITRRRRDVGDTEPTLSIALFSGTDDKLNAAALLTAGAAALGRKVDILLQYWALDAFRAGNPTKDHGLAPEAGPDGAAAVQRLAAAGGGQHWSAVLAQAKELGDVRAHACSLSTVSSSSSRAEGDCHERGHCEPGDRRAGDGLPRPVDVADRRHPPARGRRRGGGLVQRCGLGD